ncbi:MAG: translocation/assembly module TamB domain-containing protein, partial [Gammaproteobacteria bacterium]|nr:translocation/assembly module TamB domain-containing protein [Gammaproteobacteria bacterium]
LDTRVQLDDLPETTLELTGEADLESIQVGQLAAHNDLGRLSATGNARWLPGQEFDLAYTLSEIDPSILHDAVTGTLRLEGKTNVRLGEQSPVVDLEIDRLDGNVNGYAVLGNASVRYASDTLSIAESRFRIGSNRVDIAGSLGKTLSLGADMDIPALAEIIPEASGAIQGNVMISGSRASPNAKADITGSSLEYQAYSLGKLSVAADISPAKSSYAELQFDEVSAGQMSLDSLYVSANGRLDNHTIKTALSHADSRIGLEASGGYADSQWAGLIDLLEFNSNTTGLWSTDQSSQLTASAEEILLSTTCLRGTGDRGHACVGGSRVSAGSASFELSISDLPLSAIPAIWPANISVSGYLNADVNGDIVDQRLTGEFGVSFRDPVLNAVVDDEPVSVTVTQAIGQATINDNRVESTFRLELAEGAGNGNVEVSIQDVADIQSAIAGAGEITINDASLFAVFIPGVTNPQGTIKGAVTATGSLSAPEFVGEIILTDGAFGVRQSGIQVSDFEVRLAQEAAGQLRLTGRARSGDGQVSIEGLSRISAESGMRAELAISGENFELARLPDWRVNASPEINVVLDERSTLITGELAIPTADVTVKEIPESAESPSRDTIVHGAEGEEARPGRRIEIDIRTTVGPDVQLAGYGLRTGLEGSVRLQGGTHAPYVGNGKLTLRDGQYKAYGQDLEIERGELIFNGPLENPQLDIRAVRRLTDVVAGIRVTGTPLQLRSEVYSEPALSDSEALSYLLTGRPLANATSAGEGDTLNNAAFALGLSGAGPITSQIRTGLGLETLTVEGGSEDGRIIAGKRFGDRLLVEYGYGIIDKLGTLLLRYQLSERLILESRTGTVSNLDIVYSVKKK